MDKLNELFNKFQEYFIANPRYAYLIGAVILAIFGLGSISGKSWATDPANSNQRIWYNILGGKWFGRIIGILFLLGALGFLLAFMYTK